MATYSTGLVVTFDGTTFAEVSDLSWDYGGGPATGRATGAPVFKDSPGSLTLTAYGVAGMTTDTYGKFGVLSVTEGGAALTTNAVCEGLSVQCQVNGVTRYTMTFRFIA